MSKGLEYIRDISCLISENYSDKESLTEEQKLSKNCFLDYCKYIAKELKALEIIKYAYKVCDVFTLLKEDGKFYLIEASGFTCMEISQEEYELLKEVLENDNSR